MAERDPDLCDHHELADDADAGDGVRLPARRAARMPAPAMPGHDPAHDADRATLPVRRRRTLMYAVMAVSVCQFFDATIANVALPHMRASLGASPDTISWVLTSFILAGAVFTPITGWLAD